MIENNLLELLCGDLVSKSLSFYDLSIFALASFILVSILFLYYHKIPKSNNSKPKFDNPLYQSKDILLQSNNLDANFILAEKTASTFTKTLVYILILIVAFTPLYKIIWS